MGLVNFLCAEMAAAFAAAGRSVPPWRAQVQLYATMTCPHDQQIHQFQLEHHGELLWSLSVSLHTTPQPHGNACFIA